MHHAPPLTSGPLDYRACEQFLHDAVCRGDASLDGKDRVGMAALGRGTWLLKDYDLPAYRVLYFGEEVLRFLPNGAVVVSKAGRYGSGPAAARDRVNRLGPVRVFGRGLWWWFKTADGRQYSMAHGHVVRLTAVFQPELFYWWALPCRDLLGVWPPRDGVGPVSLLSSDADLLAIARAVEAGMPLAHLAMYDRVFDLMPGWL